MPKKWVVIQLSLIEAVENVNSTSDNGCHGEHLSYRTDNTRPKLSKH